MARRAQPVEVKAARLVEKGFVLPELVGTDVEKMISLLNATANAGYKIVPVPTKKIVA